MKRIKTIAIDVDDVLMPHVEALLEYYSKAYDIKLADDDLAKFGLLANALRSSGVDRDTFIADIERYLTSPDFHEIEPFGDAIVAINRLKSKYNLNIVTARPKALHDQTKNWLDQHFPGIFEDVRFTNYGIWGYPDKTESKANVCQVLGADILIDDSPNHIIEAADCGMSGILFGSYPWNIDVKLPKNAIRVKNWDEALERLM